MAGSYVTHPTDNTQTSRAANFREMMDELFASSPLLFVAVVFLFSLLIGSFLNVVIYRLPIMMEREWRAQCAEFVGSAASTGTRPADPERFDLVTPRSRCPSCGNPITALQNIPVLSYLFLRGRCAN